MTRAILFLLTTTALLACGPRYKAIELTLRNQPPVPVRVDGDEIEIPLGIAVSVHAEVFSSTNLEYTDEDIVDLESRDRDILQVEATEGERNFVLVAMAVGETCLAVEVNFDEEECIPVRVTAP